MLKPMKSFTMIVMVVTIGMLFCLPVHEKDKLTIKDLHEQYKQAVDLEKRKDALIELSKKEPKTIDDLNELRSIFSKENYDGGLFDASIESLKKVKNPLFDNVLIEILKDEKPFADKVANKDFGGMSNSEIARRNMNIMFIIGKLGVLQSKNAVPILKDYLNSPYFQYQASQALAQIGDKIASEQLRGKAYKGDDVNYGGQGSDEALTIVRDLEDRNKKDQWPKIAKQIIHIHDPKAKPQLKRLFNHEVMHVRWESAAKFRQLVDENDVAGIIEMSKNPDDIVRVEAIHAMKNLKNIEFGDELISMLNDPAYIVRLTAAKAIGYKHILRAVPYLEKAIRDSEMRFKGKRVGKNEYQNELGVREEAYIALYILTGKKYDYEGKTARVERKAEEQKSVPTFY